jgi:ABC-type glutathione transport system ATPase component
MPLLEVSGARVVFHGAGHETVAVADAHFVVNEGECVAIVGESGSGKTTLARAILGLQRLDAGEIRWRGAPLQAKARAAEIGMIWQDPYASLDPRWRIGRTLAEPGRLNGTNVDVAALMAEVGLDPTHVDRYPHQLSGGQRQRVAIGRALALRPGVVLCDEPTAALDLSVQAQILNLLRDLRVQRGCAYLYISHDLHTVRFVAERVLVMQSGVIVEQGPVEQVFQNPEHEYTRALLAAAPALDFV